MNAKQIKKVVILGATGSLGKQSIEVLEKYKKHFQVIGISANTNEKLLNFQAKKLGLKKTQALLVSKSGKKKLLSMAALKEADIIINVLAGTSGIEPSQEALKAGKTLLLGNKESLISEGIKLLKFHGKIVPIDSEHNAIFEIIRKFPKKKIEKIIIPCSGGPFWNRNKSQIEKITAKDIMKHPKWDLGKKILVESATLINKGFEIIEAYYLFMLPLKKIETMIHPQCMVHGIVKFTDGENFAYVSKPDMREHIENALTFAAGIKSPKREIRKLKKDEYKFENPNHEVLQGINIVLKTFQQNPYKMKSFLEKEEKVIKKFLQGKMKLTEIFTACL
jgi:1-deoxy-D-xylulose-5-phosphate reductoisomerase